MHAATRANVRTAEAARAGGQAKALRVAFSGGAVMGLAVASLGLAGIGLVMRLWLGLATDDAGWRAYSEIDRKSTRLNSSHGYISYAVFCLKKKKKNNTSRHTRRRNSRHACRYDHYA